MPPPFFDLKCVLASSKELKGVKYLGLGSISASWRLSLRSEGDGLMNCGASGMTHRRSCSALSLEVLLNSCCELKMNSYFKYNSYV
jgi:hypothetical protein